MLLLRARLPGLQFSLLLHFVFSPSTQTPLHVCVRLAADRFSLYSSGSIKFTFLYLSWHLTAVFFWSRDSTKLGYAGATICEQLRYGRHALRDGRSRAAGK